MLENVAMLDNIELLGIVGLLTDVILLAIVVLLKNIRLLEDIGPLESIGMLEGIELLDNVGLMEVITLLKVTLSFNDFGSADYVTTERVLLGEDITASKEVVRSGDLKGSEEMGISDDVAMGIFEDVNSTDKDMIDVLGADDEETEPLRMEVLESDPDGSLFETAVPCVIIVDGVGSGIPTVDEGSMLLAKVERVDVLER